MEPPQIFEESRVTGQETVVLVQVQADQTPFLVMWVQGMATGADEQSETRATGIEKVMDIGGSGDREGIFIKSRLSRVMAEP